MPTLLADKVPSHPSNLKNLRKTKKTPGSNCSPALIIIG